MTGSQGEAVSLAHSILGEAVGRPSQIDESLILNWQAKRLLYNFRNDFGR
jgi:hypothetical protein